MKAGSIAIVGMGLTHQGRALGSLDVELRRQALELALKDAGLERDAIERAIAKNGGNISRAVKELGISRRALYYKLRKYDI